MWYIHMYAVEKIEDDSPMVLSTKKNSYMFSVILVFITMFLYCTYMCKFHHSVQHLGFEASLKSDSEEMQDPAAYLRNNANKTKTILLWSGIYTIQYTENLTVNCGIYQCVSTFNRLLLPQSDAIIMVNGYIKANDLPTVRFPWQRWVFKSAESPLNHRPPRVLNGKINWTLTYHRTADIPHTFGFYRRIGSDGYGPFQVST